MTLVIHRVKWKVPIAVWDFEADGLRTDAINCPRPGQSVRSAFVSGPSPINPPSHVRCPPDVMPLRPVASGWWQMMRIEEGWRILKGINLSQNNVLNRSRTIELEHIIEKRQENQAYLGPVAVKILVLVSQLWNITPRGSLTSIFSFPQNSLE